MISYLPHGIMIGAGLVSLVQAALMLFKRSEKTKKSQDEMNCSVTMDSMRKTLTTGFLAYLAIALFLALITGIYTEMGIVQLIIWILFAAFAAIASELVVGLSDLLNGRHHDGIPSAGLRYSGRLYSRYRPCLYRYGH